VAEYHADYLRCIEPVYREFIDPIQSRRMSRLIKMGIAAARMSLADAGIPMPGAIITGTGLGSVEDTEKILGEITREERFLNPTPFIQSTYNTISSQVAIQLKCHSYNSTYVHRTFSFESSLLDGMLQIGEGTKDNILVAGIDEMTMNHLNITRRIGLWKREPVHNLSVLSSGTPGALAGEGAAFFTIGRDPLPSAYCRIADTATFLLPGSSAGLSGEITRFLGRNGLCPADIDVVMTGMNGDVRYDGGYRQLVQENFPDAAIGVYKHLCGEYHTATGFGLRTAAMILRNQEFPSVLRFGSNEPARLKNILIYNHFRNVNHSLILVSHAD
jgi:3-oxoacyl-(acyl-carrier-protein) synthase